MILIHDVYKFIPTYRLTLPGYPTRETIHQIGVASFRPLVASSSTFYPLFNVAHRKGGTGLGIRLL